MLFRPYSLVAYYLNESLVITTLLTKIHNTSRFTRYFRIGRVATHILLGITTVSMAFPFTSAASRLKITQWWHQRLLAALNLQISTHGHVPSPNQAISGTMVVANHISWLDIHALNSVVPLRFIAKSEIRHWPIFGYLAQKAGVLFIDRDKRKDAVRVAHMTADSLSAGDNLCLFPEGTTTDGTTLMPFKSGIIQAALHANAVLQPVAIRYPHHNGGANTQLAYAGDTTMKQSITQILLQKNPKVELHFLAPINIAQLSDEDKDRRKLSAKIEQNIKEKLGLNLA